jgi:glycosyltransferase involved in cell wall biosynthesis
LKGNKVSIIIPVHNESKILKNSNIIYKDIKEFGIFDEFEILLCDNGSTDDSLERIKTLSTSYPDIKTISVKEKGLGHGLRAGIIGAKNDILIFYPIDRSFDLSFIPISFSKLTEENLDIIIGSKGIQGSKVFRPFFRKILSKIFNFLINLLLGLDIKDSQGTLTFRKSKVIIFLDKIKSNDLFFSVELLANARKYNLKILEIPVIVDDLRKSTNINPIKDSVYNFLKLLNYWRITKIS